MGERAVNDEDGQANSFFHRREITGHALLETFEISEFIELDSDEEREAETPLARPDEMHEDGDDDEKKFEDIPSKTRFDPEMEQKLKALGEQIAVKDEEITELK